MRLLVGDIGGTNARLVLYQAPDDPAALLDKTAISSHEIISQIYYKNNDFQSFSEVLWSFVSTPDVRGSKIHSCCLAVAGPVADNHINFTNREGWIIDGNSIKEEFGIDTVELINDFVANGYGLLSLKTHDLSVLQEGKTVSHGQSTFPVVLVGAGTGLGECYLTPSSAGHLKAFPTEGGHVEFAPRTRLEMELLTYIQTRLNTDPGDQIGENDVLPRVSVERLVSGKGLENIYEYLREKFPDQVDHTRDAEYNESNERGRLIGAEKNDYKLFRRALEIMFSIFGGEVGNCALKYLPYGGVYIAGGIAPKNIEFINGPESEFMHRFWDKGRMSSIMADFPVYVVMKEDLGLRGAHSVASERAAGLVDVRSKARVSGLEEASPKLPSKESSMQVTEALREAVTTYPMTYALVTSLTSAITAGVVVGGLHVLKRMKIL
eukprot:GFKZ01015740.1.p1 GENE.GFKZ01015740.1~~GFKZ01015740.1.p1  ORF type:complete len:436 (-),score=55.18 GFKZ01015740.1:396-1703(-)